MSPSLAWNKQLWGHDYAWPAAGAEWSAEHGLACGVTAQQWEADVVRTFIVPHVTPRATALEIGAGHGRWGAHILPRVQLAYLVDVNQACTDYCKQRFKAATNVACLTNDGTSLAVPDGWTDFAFSWDTFVHIDEPEVRGYAGALKRAMRRQALGVIHHAGSPTAAQRAAGCRTTVTGAQFAKILADNGLVVIRQVDAWPGGNVKLAGDLVTVFVRP